MDKYVEILKDEVNQQPIPTIWRPVLFKIVEAFKEGDCNRLREVENVRSISDKDFAIFLENVVAYGANLTALSDSTWQTSVCLWMRGYWDVLVDLYTVEEGASDLALFASVYEVDDRFSFEIISIHVP